MRNLELCGFILENDMIKQMLILVKCIVKLSKICYKTDWLGNRILFIVPFCNCLQLRLFNVRLL